MFGNSCYSYASTGHLNSLNLKRRNGLIGPNLLLVCFMFRSSVEPIVRNEAAIHYI